MTTNLDVFGAGIEVRPLKEPGICFICEATPQQDVERVVNTMRYFTPGPITKLSGTKYVCEGCATDLGKSMGLVDRDQYDDVCDLVSSLTQEIIEKDRKLSALESLQAAIAELKQEPQLVN